MNCSAQLLGQVGLYVNGACVSTGSWQSYRAVEKTNTIHEPTRNKHEEEVSSVISWIVLLSVADAPQVFQEPSLNVRLRLCRRMCGKAPPFRLRVFEFRRLRLGLEA
jgi:hypothetical protein